MENPISQFLQERIDANDFPSAVYLVAEKGEIVFHDALGLAVVEPDKIEARTDTIYDLASLTKPLVTGLICASLIENQEFKLETEASFLAKRLHVPDKRGITVLDLLTHTSGLPAWRPFYFLVEDKSQVISAIAAEPTVSPTEVVYSDLNFLILESIVSSVLGKGLDEIFGEIIGDSLDSTCFNPSSDVRLRIAASEKGNAYEKNTCIELGYKPDEFRIPHSAFRTELIWGEVHDGNAWFMNGVAGHAGLFSTAEEVFKLASEFLPNYTTVLKPKTTELFRTNFTKGMNEDRSFAFQLASTENSTAGSKMSPESFGHLGFTGTSLWIDPVKERIFILLTNRTHAHPLPFVNINSVRRHFHDLANDFLDR